MNWSQANYKNHLKIIELSKLKVTKCKQLQKSCTASFLNPLLLASNCKSCGGLSYLSLELMTPLELISTKTKSQGMVGMQKKPNLIQRYLMTRTNSDLTLVVGKTSLKIHKKHWFIFIFYFLRSQLHINNETPVSVSQSSTYLVSGLYRRTKKK